MVSNQPSNSNLNTKPFSNVQQQVDLLRFDRNLIVKDVAVAKKKLLETNYFDLINGFETLLLMDKDNKILGYENKSFDDFLSLYNFDKELSKEILAVISLFESKLKTSLAYHFCETYCCEPIDTLEYLSKHNYEDPSNAYGPNHPSYRDYHQNRFILFKTSYGRHQNLNYVEYMKNIKPYIGRYTKPPFWVVIKTFNMGDLLSMIRLMKSTVIKEVLKDFNLTPADTDLFINSIEIIKDLRNTCAHFELINRFRSSGSYPINNDLITKLELNTLSPQTSQGGRRNNQYRIRLFDALKVLALFNDIKPIRKVVVRYYDRNVSIRKKYLVLPLLDRMGEPSIIKWKKLGDYT